MTQRALDVDVIKQCGGQQTAARRVQVKRARASSSPRSKRRAEGRLRSGGRWLYGEAQVRCTRRAKGWGVRWRTRGRVLCAKSLDFATADRPIPKV